MQELKRRAIAAMDAINNVSDEINTIIAEFNALLAPITLTWWPDGKDLSFCVGAHVVGWAVTADKGPGRRWQLVVGSPTGGGISDVKPLAEATRYIRNLAVSKGIVEAVAREVVKHAEKVAAETGAAAEAGRELRYELEQL